MNATRLNALRMVSNRYTPVCAPLNLGTTCPKWMSMTSTIFNSTPALIVDLKQEFFGRGERIRLKHL